MDRGNRRRTVQHRVLLAVSGLYGLVSYAVSQRAPEIGLRMAIGATERDVQRMILRLAARAPRGPDRTGAGAQTLTARNDGPSPFPDRRATDRRSGGRMFLTNAESCGLPPT